MKLRKLTQLAIGFGISAFFVWLMLRAVPISELASALEQVHIGWVVAALVFFTVDYACRIWRWRLMLVPENPTLEWGRCTVSFMASIAANNILPFRAGDVLRAVSFSGWLGVPTASVLATMLVERMLDLLSLLLAFGFVLILTGSQNNLQHILPSPSVFLIILPAVLIMMLLLAPNAFEPPIRWWLQAVGKKSPGLADIIGLHLGYLFSTLRTITQRSRMLVLLLLSTLIWGFEACVFYAVACSIPNITEPIAGWLAMPIGTLSTLIPSTPGYVGTFHFTVATATEAFGNTIGASTAFAILIHLTLWIPATLTGGACFTYWIFRRSAPINSK